MSSKKSISPIENKVMSKIQSGEVSMHPKIYFVITGALVAVAVILVGLINAYFMSVVSLWMRLQIVQGQAYGLKRNLETAIGSFPWWSLILGALSILVMVYVIRKVGWMYRISLAKLVLLAIAASLLVGFALSYSSLPNTFNRRNAACVTCNGYGANHIDKTFYNKMK